MESCLRYSAMMNLNTKVSEKMNDLSERFDAIERFQIEQKEIILENKENINDLTCSVKIVDDLISTMWREYVAKEYDHCMTDTTEPPSNDEGWITRFVKSKCARRPKASYTDAINSTTLATPTFITKGNYFLNTLLFSFVYWSSIIIFLTLLHFNYVCRILVFTQGVGHC
jgi:hypothetical protein